MSGAFSEMPLALFTAFASMGAGAFITLAVAFFTTQFSEEQLKKIDKVSLVPAIIVLVGFVAAFFHLANPLASIGVFSGIGRSPLSNELCVAMLFAAVMAVYVIMGLMGKLGAMRKGLVAVLAALAVLFAVFMGLAYSIDTITTWSTPWPVVQMVGYALVGGAAVGMSVLAFADAADTACEGSFKTAVIAIALGGTAIALVGLALMASGAGSASNAIVDGGDLVSGVTLYIVASAICLLAACGCTAAVAMKKASAMVAALGVLFAFAGILAGRFVFYGLQVSVGIFFG